VSETVPAETIAVVAKNQHWYRSSTITQPVSSGKRIPPGKIERHDDGIWPQTCRQDVSRGGIRGSMHLVAG
jgi:hypothetical protein